MNPLLLLREAGQSVWLDYLRRGLVTGGGLERLIREDGLSGVTSNPTIFGKAVGGSTDYDEAIAPLSGGGGSARDVFYELALEDIRAAADLFRARYSETEGGDGFVSFELEADLAHDAAGSVEAAVDLFRRIGRPNSMIKVPGTKEGVEAAQELTARGVNVNITLLFSVETYEQVALAYVAGLERRLDAREPLDRIASVASFFVSRVDSSVDARLPEGSPLRGRVAVANARVPTTGSARSSRGNGGSAWPGPGRASSGPCGHRPPPRTRPTGTCCTWRSWSARTPSTPCPRARSTRSGATASSGPGR